MVTSPQNCLLFKTGSTEFSLGKLCVSLNQSCSWRKSAGGDSVSVGSGSETVSVIMYLCAKTEPWCTIPQSGVGALPSFLFHQTPKQVLKIEYSQRLSRNTAHTVIHHCKLDCLFLSASHITLSLELGITELIELITVEKKTPCRIKSLFD